MRVAFLRFGHANRIRLMNRKGMMRMTAERVREAAIIGAGIAGLQAAIQLGRYQHDAIVIDKGKGRSTLCQGYHNLLGWPDGVSGEELRAKGREHAERYGIPFREDEVVALESGPDGTFCLRLRTGQSIRAKTVLLATGVKDAYPELPGLEACMGKSVFVCPDCDGYETRGKKTLVLGSGDSGANMAATLHYYNDRIMFLNHEGKQPGHEAMTQLEKAGIDMRNVELKEINHDNGQVSGVRLSDGAIVHGEAAFIAFGGNRVHTELAGQVGALLHENKHVVTDPRTKETSVKRLFAAGDIGLHAEQASVAIGEGMLAAIWMHKAIVGAAAAEREPQLV